MFPRVRSLLFSTSITCVCLRCMHIIMCIHMNKMSIQPNICIKISKIFFVFISGVPGELSWKSSVVICVEFISKIVDSSLLVNEVLLSEVNKRL